MKHSKINNSTLHHSTSSLDEQWQQGALIEVVVTDLNHDGDGVGRWQGRVVFVPDTVPGDRIRVRLIRVKPQYAYGKLHELLDASPYRIRPSCIVADKCGGCQWQHIDYSYQAEAKRNRIIQELQRIGGFSSPPVQLLLSIANAHDRLDDRPDIGEHLIQLSSPQLGYRNKATYPLARSTATGQVQAGYYQKGSHQLINLNQCPIQDSRLNPLLADIKQDIQAQGWSIYNETQHRGKLRHLGLRIGRHTGEMLLTLVARDGNLSNAEAQANEWLSRYPQLVGVCLNVNPDRTNVIFGKETRCLAGRSYLREAFAGLEFRIQSTTFFQVNTEQAEALLQCIETELNLSGNEVLLDAYCGIGTLTLPLAKQVHRAIGIEIHSESIDQARINAEINHITNVEFYAGAVEQVLPSLSVQPHVVLLDPPRKGCDRSVIETLLTLRPRKIVYVSCNPSTLARDLKLLCQTYQLTNVQPADFFPQTAHVECAAFLTLPS